MTATTAQVLVLFTKDPKAEWYGLQIMAETGLPSGTVFPILARLEALGWLGSGWEDVDPSSVGRPARRYYRLTPPGLAGARAALARAAGQRRSRLSAARRSAEGLA